jgi:putative transposase
VARRAPEEDALVKRIHALAKQYPRYGYRRIHALLVREGWRVNRKRVQRLWRAEGLKVVRRQRKRRRLGSSENGCVRHRAEHKNHVWSYDFTLDQTADGRRLKLMPVVDEFTRECHTIEVERSITAEEVIATLSYLFRVHGEPEYIRSDNGPEFIAKAVREWLACSGVKTLYIEPGSPWENAYLESFNGKLEDELLGREIFTSLLEAKVVIEQYRVAYNHERPHSSLGYQTPVEFAATCRTREAAGADEQSLPRPRKCCTRSAAIVSSRSSRVIRWYSRASSRSSFRSCSSSSSPASRMRSISSLNSVSFSSWSSGMRFS